jgi:hypothetical protein
MSTSSEHFYEFGDFRIEVAALQSSPAFDALRTDARYETLLRRLGLKALRK